MCHPFKQKTHGGVINPELPLSVSTCDFERYTRVILCSVDTLYQQAGLCRLVDVCGVEGGAEGQDVLCLDHHLVTQEVYKVMFHYEYKSKIDTRSGQKFRQTKAGKQA